MRLAWTPDAVPFTGAPWTGALMTAQWLATPSTWLPSVPASSVGAVDPSADVGTSGAVKHSFATDASINARRSNLACGCPVWPAIMDFTTCEIVHQITTRLRMDGIDLQRDAHQHSLGNHMWPFYETDTATRRTHARDLHSTIGDIRLEPPYGFDATADHEDAIRDLWLWRGMPPIVDNTQEVIVSDLALNPISR